MLFRESSECGKQLAAAALPRVPAQNNRNVSTLQKLNWHIAYFGCLPDSPILSRIPAWFLSN